MDGFVSIDRNNSFCAEMDGEPNNRALTEAFEDFFSLLLM